MTNSRALGLFFLIGVSVITASCAGGEDEQSGNRVISNPTTQGTTNTSLPGCEEYTKGLDTDGDGLKDYDEFVGTPVGTSSAQRTNPFEADTDADGKSDSLELNGLRKVDGLNIENLLKNPVVTHPLHRDFIILVHAQGGEDSTRIYASNNRNGWNIYDGIGSPDMGKEDSRILRRPDESELVIRNLPFNAIDRVVLGADKTNWLPNKCQTTPGDLDCNCHQGDGNPNSQEGCTNFSGLRFSNNTRGPQQNCSGAPYYQCANNGFRNSIVARFIGSSPTFGGADRYSASAGMESFRVGSIGDINGSAGQVPTSGGGSVPIEYMNDFTWKLTLSTAQDGLNLMLRVQDSNDGTDDNSGFSALNLRYMNSDSAYLNQYAAFLSDADKKDKLKTFYQSTAYANKCQVPVN